MTNNSGTTSTIPAQTLVERALQAVDRADETAARRRAVALTNGRPHAAPDELVELLIRNKALQTGGRQL